jgi:hypothetical protein
VFAVTAEKMNRGHFFVLAKQSLGFSRGIIVSAAIMSSTVVVCEFADAFVAESIFNGWEFNELPDNTWFAISLLRSGLSASDTAVAIS